MYYQGQYPKTPNGIKTESFHDKIRQWVRTSERSSVEPVLHKSRNKIRTPEEKLKLVQKVLEEGVCRPIAEEEGVPSTVLYEWVRKYKMEGYEGLVPKKKGRPPKEPQDMPKKKVEPTPLTESEREEPIRLRAEMAYMKAEVAAIKKLMALRREKEAARLEAKRQQRSKNSKKKDTD